MTTDLYSFLWFLLWFDWNCNENKGMSCFSSIELELDSIFSNFNGYVGEKVKQTRIRHHTHFQESPRVIQCVRCDTRFKISSEILIVMSLWFWAPTEEANSTILTPLVWRDWYSSLRADAVLDSSTNFASVVLRIHTVSQIHRKVIVPL